jgi:ketosteroid isomerase-like protein
MTTATETSPEAQVRERLALWTAAVRDRDIEGVLSHHAHDVVMFDVPPPVQLQGIDAYRKSWELFFRHFPKEGGRFNLDEFTVAVSGDIACAYGIVTCGSRESPFPVRLTVCLRRQGGEWIIAHEHHSVPAEA